MRTPWRIFVSILGCLVFVVIAFLVFMGLALRTLESKDSELSTGLSVEEVDRYMGRSFRSRIIRWGDIPDAYAEWYVAKNGDAIREYSFLGLSGLSIVVIFNEEGHSYSKIPVYE